MFCNWIIKRESNFHAVCIYDIMNDLMSHAHTFYWCVDFANHFSVEWQNLLNTFRVM